MEIVSRRPDSARLLSTIARRLRTASSGGILLLILLMGQSKMDLDAESDTLRYIASGWIRQLSLNMPIAEFNDLSTYILHVNAKHFVQRHANFCVTFMSTYRTDRRAVRRLSDHDHPTACWTPVQ